MFERIVPRAWRQRSADGRRRRWTKLHLLALLAVVFIFGCTFLNSFILVPKQNLSATPAKYNLAYQEIWFTARDGTELNGWWLPAATSQPLVLYFHGNAGNLADNLEYLDLLHGCGFPIFVFDYRGFGKSNGEAIHENDLFSDGRGALAYLHQRGWRSKDMIFFGQSMGSAVAVEMALESKPMGLVLEGTFTSMKDMVKHVSSIGYYTVAIWSMTLPLDNLTKIDRVNVPVLLIHGEHDGVVPVEMTMRLYARAKEPKMLHIVPDGGHCDVFMHDPARYASAWASYYHSLTMEAASPPSTAP